MHHITLDLLNVLTERDLDAMGINIIGDRLKVLRGLQQWRDKIGSSHQQQHPAKTQSTSDTTSTLPDSVVTSSSLSSSSHSSSLLLPLSSESVAVTSSTMPHSLSSALLTDSEPNKTELSSEPFKG
jgi:hypothetical protein